MNIYANKNKGFDTTIDPAYLAQSDISAGAIKSIEERVKKLESILLYDTINGVRNELDVPAEIENQDPQRLSYTINEDDSISVTVLEDIPENARLLYYNSYIEEGDYIFSCGENSTSTPGASGYDCFIWDENTSTTLIRDNDDEAPYSKAHIPAGTYQVRIRIRPNTPASIGTILFKPMLRPANITDDTFVSPTATNEELTRRVTALEKKVN